MEDVEKAQNVHPGQYKNFNGSAHARPHRVANPSPLGLFSFASTTFIISMYNLQARGVTTPNVIVGMAIFCGGLVQLLAGMFEFCHMNMFAATAFSSFGAYWLSYATILIPSSGIIAAYADGPANELDNAIGIFLVAWVIVTILLFLVALRKSVAYILLFGVLIVTFSLLAAGKFTASSNITKAGGGFGLVAAFAAYYIGFAELLAGEPLAPIRVPLGEFSDH